MQNVPTQIIVHHDGVSRAGASFDIIDAFHKTREFPLSSLGFYVGYHMWIERDGFVRRAREDNEEGAHTKGQNFASIGIGLAGNFDAEDPTPEQIASLGALLAQYCTKYNLQATRIFPHRRYAGKSCYGLRLDDNWAALVYLRFEYERISALIAALTAGVE